MATASEPGKIPVVQQIEDIANRTSKLGRLEFQQWTQTVLLASLLLGVAAVLIWAARADDRRGTQLERMQGLALAANDKVVQAEKEAIAERVELRNAIQANTQALGRLEDKVLDRLLGLKRDTDVIKKDIKEVKENPPIGPGPGAGRVRVPKLMAMMPPVEVLPMPRPCDQ